MKTACFRKSPFNMLIIAFTLILSTGLPAIGMRIDGSFEDLKDVQILTSDPKGDAKGAFDVTRVDAASQGSMLYIRFDTGSIVNLQNGPKRKGSQ